MPQLPQMLDKANLGKHVESCLTYLLMAFGGTDHTEADRQHALGQA